MGRRKQRRKKIKTDPLESISFVSFPEELEEITRDLFEKACCGSRSYWSSINSPKDIQNNKELRKKFMAAAHSGMRSAQDKIIAAYLSEDRPSAPEKILYSGIADSIAWQLLETQLSHARRFFKGQNQPDLYNSNFESAVSVVQNLTKEKPDCIPLLSDLTSFVQVGDILQFDSETGLTIVEVKEGEKNKEIMDFLSFYKEAKCDRAMYYFMKNGGKKTIKQFERILRQYSRMGHVTEVLHKGQSVDPDTKKQITIPEEYIEMRSWDENLNCLIEDSESKGWAIDVIDDCLFVGCYSENPMKIGGHIIFRGWFNECGGDDECPFGRLIDSMMAPLALPVFNRFIPHEAKFDFLFGRKQLCMAVSIDDMLKKCEEVGMKYRIASNKESGRMSQLGQPLYKYKNKPIIITKNDREMILGDGIFFRAMYHGQSPISVISSYLDYEPIEAPNNCFQGTP